MVETKGIRFTVQLAGQTIGITCGYLSTKEFLREYLCETCDCQAQIHVTVSSEDVASERERSAKEDRKAGIGVRHFSAEYLETLALYRKIAEQLVDRGILLFHGSCIAVDGEGYLFTARSGTGKSTHTRLWRQVFGERAVMVNDDKPLLQISDQQVVAYGTPWDGKHGLSSNCGVPLRAICLLERAAENHIKKITKQEAYVILVQQMYRPREPLQLTKALELLEKMADTVELYRLGCNQNVEAAKIAYQMMK